MVRLLTYGMNDKQTLIENLVCYNLGLDPAGPLYGTNVGIGTFQIDNRWRLDPSDAQYVQCIETSYVGINTHKFPCGHANFVMYGGKLQPVCNRVGIMKSLTKCDHSSARFYFGLALNPENEFIGIKKGCSDKCSSKENMDKIGIYSDRKHGLFNVEIAQKNQ